MLYKLAAECRGESVEDGTSPSGEKRGFRPAKLFSIDRVFRNETMDATHLAEFHQVEGVVADRGLTLADLIGIVSSKFVRILMIEDGPLGFMRVFFKKMGIEKVRFKPAYNPYTEVRNRHNAIAYLSNPRL